MSQTETILLIVLGFSLASLVGLFMGRLLWTAAIRIGARRMQRQVPSSLVGLQTERDRLRAEYAMLSQRLGARLEEAKARLAEQTAEVSRHRNRIFEVERTEGARSAELRRLTAQVKSLEQEVADAKVLENELRQALAAKEEALRKLRKKRGYEGHKSQQEKPAPIRPFTEDPELRLRQRIEKLSELAKTTIESESAESQIAAKLEEAEFQTHTLEAELQKLEAEWSAATPAEKAARATDIAPLPATEPAPPPPPETDNVILLPNRSREPKTGTGPAS